jgi:DNA-binding MarR family transcriptional regulator
MSSTPETLGWLVKRLQHRHHRALDENLAALEVSLVQWNALREIARHPGAPQRQLAEHTFNSVQAFGTLVARLQARGLVERRPGLGRATAHRLTARGKKVLREGQEVMSSVVAASFGRLSGRERAELARLLVKVLEAPSR